MPRIATLREKDGHWATDAGGKTKRFGRVADTPHAVALRRFREYLGQEGGGSAEPVSVAELAKLFLSWVSDHRGAKAHKERSRHVNRFLVDHGHLDCSAVRSAHMDGFIEGLAKDGHAPDYIEKHATSVKAMFARGARKGWIPVETRPFAGVEPIRKDPKALTEEKLPTDGEVARLIEAATGDMADMIRLYHACGARTGELIAVRAGDFQRAGRTIVLAKHKRSHTLRRPTPRTITLNPMACEIMARRSEGLAPDQILFPRPRDGQPHTNGNIAERFQSVRKRAGVRSSLTIYSFRHLFISELLMAGVDLLLVARMAGTGVRMVESVYGHFRTQSFHDAQARLDAVRAGRATGG